MGPAIDFGAHSTTHAEVGLRAARIASGLRALGVSEGDRVALVLRNDVAFVEISVGIGLLGAVPVPVNWHLKAEEIAYLLADSGSRVVFAHSDLVATVEAALPVPLPLIEVPVPAEIARAFGIAGPSTAPTGRHPELASWRDTHPAWTEPPATAPMSMIYTSGTTGRPKGVVRERTAPDQTRRIAAAVMEAFGLRPGMRTLIPAPLYHAAPNVHALVSIAAGIDLTIMPRFDAAELLQLIETRRISHIQVVPTMLVRLLQLPEAVRSRYDTSSLECIVHAAAPCPAHVKRGTIEWLGPVLREYYGGTETGPVVSCDSAEWLAHPGTVGRPIADADIRILAPNGEVLPHGEVGQVYVRPPSCWPAFTYLGDAAKRESIEREGHVTMGDVGYLDGDGYLYLTDRATDMVISGGVNIYPAEIEHCLQALPGVRDVAVFGIPDDLFGESLAAHVDADPTAGLTAEAIRCHVRQHLAGYKVPKVVVFDDRLPREDSGKLFKRRIRERYVTQVRS
jgi:long-chain acyl-CoA synthetase